MSVNERKEKPGWFSIKEAAEYLAVGEPTLYRWMKEGQITYRKVGDSTRFLQEDLDAVTKVYPSQEEVKKVVCLCPVCHHDELVEGRVQSTGLVYFRPKKTKFWTLKDSNIDTHARMCPRCGSVFLFGDLEKLAALKSANQAAAHADPAPPSEAPPVS